MLKAKPHISDTKELVGYVIKHMIADLVCRALNNIAIKNRRLSQELIWHSDRSGQYYSHEYHKIIQQYTFKSSMSGKGNYYGHSLSPCTWAITLPRSFGNAPIESFWSILKSELVYH